MVEAVGRRIAPVVQGQRCRPASRAASAARSVDSWMRPRASRSASRSIASGHVGMAIWAAPSRPGVWARPVSDLRPCAPGTGGVATWHYRAAVAGSRAAATDRPGAPGCSPSSPTPLCRGRRSTPASPRASPATPTWPGCCCSPRRRSASRSCCWPACTTSCSRAVAVTSPASTRTSPRRPTRVIRCRRSARFCATMPASSPACWPRAARRPTRSAAAPCCCRCSACSPTRSAPSPTSTSARAPASTCCSTATSTSTNPADGSATGRRCASAVAPVARCPCRRRCRRSCSGAGSTGHPSTSTTCTAGGGWRPACGRTRPIASPACGPPSTSPPRPASTCGPVMPSATPRRSPPRSTPTPWSPTPGCSTTSRPTSARAYVDSLDELGRAQDASWIFAEMPLLVPELPVADVTESQTALVLVRWRDGVRSVDHLGIAHPHGYWLHWADGVSGRPSATAPRPPA